MKLIIVESPTKANSIGQFLGSEYQVVASKGHIRDIRKDPFGVEVDNGFSVHWIFDEGAERKEFLQSEPWQKTQMKYC